MPKGFAMNAIAGLLIVKELFPEAWCSINDPIFVGQPWQA
jgi:hypothetical protein